MHAMRGGCAAFLALAAAQSNLYKREVKGALRHGFYGSGCACHKGCVQYGPKKQGSDLKLLTLSGSIVAILPGLKQNRVANADLYVRRAELKG